MKMHFLDRQVLDCGKDSDNVKTMAAILGAPVMQRTVTVELQHLHIATILGSLSSDINIGRVVGKEGTPTEPVLQMLIDSRDKIGTAAYGKKWPMLRDTMDALGAKMEAESPLRKNR